MKEIQRSWIEKGYLIFSEEGPKGLKIERISKVVGKNKSSFYHHFADLSVFTQVLLEYHLDQSVIVSEKESKCNDLGELIDVLIEHKIDLLFNRQLRVNRENEDFETCFEKVNEISIPGIVPIWSKIIELEERSHLAELFLQLSLENFYLQITEKTLNREWLQAYFERIKTLVRQFKSTGVVPALDGTV